MPALLHSHNNYHQYYDKQYVIQSPYTWDQKFHWAVIKSRVEINIIEMLLLIASSQRWDVCILFCDALHNIPV
jgi:hypothetical protein